MSKTKAAQIADALNEYHAEHPFDFRQIAQAAADRFNVGLYWAGTACNHKGLPSADVWQISAKGQWSRKLGTVALGYDNIWRG